MAQQGSGLGKGPDGGHFSDPTKYDARSGGAAKNTQKSFDTKWGMKDADGNDESNRIDQEAGPSNAGTGPQADPPGPLDFLTPAQRGKTLKRQPANLEAKWGMTDANGKGVDNGLAGKVLGEAILSGASTLPSGESYSNSKPVRQPG